MPDPRKQVAVELAEGDRTRTVLFAADGWRVDTYLDSARPQPADGMLRVLAGTVTVAQFPYGAYAGVYFASDLS